MNFIEELRWRGLVQDIMPGTEDQLNKEMTSAYIGFDPTADSLHIGSLVPIILLVHFQRAGHKPFALVGGATGMIGDPSGKSEERSLLSEEILKQNQEGVKNQLSKFLNFDSANPNAAIMVNNYDWFKDMNFLSFIRDIGKHITVNYMTAKDSVKKRLEGAGGISFTEFTYQLIQGYDFYWLYTQHNCKMQMGGSDQWGNITTGAELIRRKTGGEAFAVTCPLLTKSNGGKFGKTEHGNVWLDAEKTSPYQFYQFWLNSSDEDAAKWIKLFTFLSKEEITNIISAHETDASKRVLQKRLAKEITIFVHSENDYNKAIETTEKLFTDQHKSLEELSAEELENTNGIVKFDFAFEKINNGIDIVTFLTDCGIMPSKSEARKMIQNGGISINRIKVENVQMILNISQLLYNKYLFIQKGKKNYFLIRAV